MAAKIQAIWNYITDLFGKDIINLIKGIRVVDVIDILLLSVFLFYIFRFIRERRAGTLAIGLLSLVVILLVSVLLDMKAIKYILQNFYQVGLIAFIVIFQADLRAALEKVGNSSIKNFTIVGDTEYNDTIRMAETVASAVDSLSRSNTGALIVFERETKLGEYLKHGTILNAEISDLLIGNLFFNKSPLHDGAVIIRDRRLYAAGCMIDRLSEADVSKSLGTRHRAALGLSESSDALVVVVSEETGTISIAINGELVRNFNQTSLKSEIIKYMIPDDSTVKKIGKGIKTGLGKKKQGKDENENER